MADIVVTASSVFKSAQGVTAQGIAGEAITQGKTVYIDTANNNVIKLADSDGSALSVAVAGISLTAAATGQPVQYCTQDPAFVFGGAGVLAGDTIWQSDTAGGITKTFGELEAGDTVTVLGVAVTTTTMNLKPTQGGVIA